MLYNYNKEFYYEKNKYRQNNDRKKVGEEISKILKENNISIGDLGGIENVLLDAVAPLIENSLNTEMDEHLGYKKHEINDEPNSRNGFSEKTIKGLFGQTKIQTPRDRDGNFEPIIVEKNQSNISKIEEAIIMLYAKGSSTRDITEYVRDIYRVKLDPTSISKITDKILPDIRAFQTQPLKKIYAVVFIDGIRFKIREEGSSKEVSVYIPLGITMEGKKEVLGFWIGESETSKYWLSVLDDMKSRGLKKILIVASDNLPGVSEAISAAFPDTKIQKCVVHQIRNSMRFVRYYDKKEFVIDMKKIYKAINIKEAEKALELFEDKWSKKYGYATRS